MKRKWGGIVLLLWIVMLTTVNASSLSWGFKKGNASEQAQAGEMMDRITKKHGAVYKGSPDEKVVYLTFDNGFENGHTERILDVLEEEKVEATFFLTGHYVTSAAPLVKRMVKEGHEIGNHSWGHPNFSTLTDAQMKEEWAKLKNKVTELTGQKEMKYVRPPEGVFTERSLELAAQEGYTHIFWSVAFVDWYADRPKGGDYAYNEVMKQVHPGAVILMHTVSKDNADAMKDIVQSLKNEGYRFETLDHLVRSAKDSSET